MTETKEYLGYEAALDLVKDEVDHVLSASPLLIRRYMEHLKLSRGKFIRAISFITCAQNKEGLVRIDAVKFAASIEILHLATLVHDDVIDNADLRRGELTLQKKYGRKTAVICGDYLLCAALKLSADVTGKKEYLDYDMPDYMSRLCLGELNQHINNGNLNLSVYQYLKIINGKTAALFEASFYGGAILSECRKEDLLKYRNLGNYIGMIFQLTDDCIDFENTIDDAKKPVQSDYEQGVITLPLIYALKNRLGFKEKAQENPVTRQEINEAVFESGGLSYTHLVTKKYYNKAIKVIMDLDITEEKRTKLISILEKASRKK